MLVAAGETWTVAQWLEHWLVDIAQPGLRHRAWEAYRIAVRVHAVPALGRHRLDKVRPDHLKALYNKMINEGRSPTTAHQVHRTLHTAFALAVESGYMPRNPATRKIAPQVRKLKVRPYEADEIRKLVDAALEQFGGVRWIIALALGLRQGELLALQWSDIDLDRGILAVDFSRARPQYRRGCNPPCGKKYPGQCPDKIRTNPERGETKSDASHRTIGMPDELTRLLQAHQLRQEAARIEAGDRWRDGGWVFTDRLGEPLNNIGDYRRWKALIKKAGVRDARLHDARHTAATTLLLLGVSERAVIDIMGWSTVKMTLVYQHITDGVRKDVADRVGTFIWGEPSVPSDATSLASIFRPAGSRSLWRAVTVVRV
ncbi:site-specific integrase [Propioniciclava sp.]|uniref:tyrosine-type recombinase/integrase n=1 Tax=Propioniciclava sp. TaxID=2038686 RepID=UPI002617108E|nr:site-specific integrase [Propioniciclava sp.]